MMGIQGIVDLLLQVPAPDTLRENLMVNKKIQYSPESLKEIKSFLSALAARASVHCVEYESFEEWMFRAYNKAFGCWNIIPDRC